MTVVYHENVVQGSDAWLRMRMGILTASEVKYILTPTLKLAGNDKQRAHVFEIAAQRISGHVEPQYISDDMLRGMQDEITARELYAEKFAPVQECGFVTNNEWGFTIGYSPDGLVGEDGLIEIKSRLQKYQVQTISNGDMPTEYMLQCQTGLLVTGREWLDFVTYSNGLHMAVIRIFPDAEIHDAILEAATRFEGNVESVISDYHHNLSALRTLPTERREIQEMF